MKDIKDYLNEEWRDVENYPKTQVSNMGRVRIKRTGRVLNQRLRKDGYLDVSIYHSLGVFKTKTVHRLVAIAFLPGYEHTHTVNHKDFNKKNNCVENLEWCTLKENIQHAINGGQRNDYGGKPFPQSEAVKLARKKIILNGKAVFDSVSDCAAHLKVKQSTVSQALRRGNKILKVNTVQYAY